MQHLLTCPKILSCPMFIQAFNPLFTANVGLDWGCGRDVRCAVLVMSFLRESYLFWRSPTFWHSPKSDASRMAQAAAVPLLQRLGLLGAESLPDLLGEARVGARAKGKATKAGFCAWISSCPKAPKCSSKKRLQLNFTALLALLLLLLWRSSACTTAFALSCLHSAPPA